MSTVPLPTSPRNAHLGRLPPFVKSALLKLYWVGYDARDFLAEAIGWIPFNRMRCFLWRRLGIKIGRHSSIHRHCRFYFPSRVEIGNHCVILREVLLDGRMGLRIESNVSISEGVSFYTMQHKLRSPNFESEGSPVTVEDYVFIGARATILPGVIIGRGAAVAAGAVVTKNVAAGTIVAGVPAVVIGERPVNLTYTLNYRKFLG